MTYPVPEDTIPEDQRVGTSNFHVTELTIPTINRPPPDFDRLLKDGKVDHEIINVLNWVWENFPGFPEEGFLESVISPFAGNPESIRANGDAWEAIGKQFGELVVNMGTNATELAAQYWVGDAADAFSKFLKTYWKDGAAWAGEQLGQVLRKAFDKAADAADAIAKAVVGVLTSIVRVARRLLQRALPWYTAWSIIEQLADLLGFDVQSVYNDVREILGYVDEIDALKKRLEGIVAALEGYFDAFTQLADVVSAIPELDSVAEARDVMTDLHEGREKMREEAEAVGKSVDAAEKSLEGVNKSIEKLDIPDR